MDLNDGALEQQYLEYYTRLVAIKNLQFKNDSLNSDLEGQFQQLRKDAEFLHESKAKFNLIFQFYCFTQSKQLLPWLHDHFQPYLPIS